MEEQGKLKEGGVRTVVQVDTKSHTYVYVIIHLTYEASGLVRSNTRLSASRWVTWKKNHN